MYNLEFYFTVHGTPIPQAIKNALFSYTLQILFINGCQLAQLTSFLIFTLNQG